MKILGIITSPTEASARARIIQYKKPLTKYNIELKPRYYKPFRYAPPPQWMKVISRLTRINQWRYYQIHRTISRLPLFLEQHKYDLIWLNRLIIHHQSFYEQRLSKPFVFDFDDAIWLNDKVPAVENALRKASLVFAGNEFLAEYSMKYNKKTIVVPTVIDTNKLFPFNKVSGSFTIGWIGTDSNFEYLDLVKPAIDKFLSENKNSKLLIVSSEPPRQFSFDGNRYIFEKWSEEYENELINKFDIGIMPLAENEFTKGKCSYKMLQYLACGKPVVVSPVGTNKKILTQMEVGLPANSTDEWLEAFRYLEKEKVFYEICAINGRHLVEKNYSVDVTSPIIAEQFGKLI